LIRQPVDTVILTGGQGSRLRAAVSDRPKTMASIKGRPFLDLLLGHLQGSGFCRFILCVGYMADYISDYYRQSPDPTRELIISREILPLGTAGALKNAESLLGGDFFLVVNGDSFCPADLPAFIDFHQKQDALASLVLTQAEEAGSYGTVVLGRDNRIVEFKEKSSSGPGWINAGLYLFNRDLLSLIPRGSYSSLEQDMFPRLVEERFLGFITREPLIDIGTPERYIEAQRSLRI
jgi:NDP-sugar pyrophosphorylase family protein